MARVAARASKRGRKGAPAVKRRTPAAAQSVTAPEKTSSYTLKGVGDSKKNKEAKVVRDSFTIPAREYELIGALKKRCLGLGVSVKKSELLRAGLAAISGLSDDQLTHAMAAVESVKTGRPSGKKDKKEKKGK